MLDQIINIYSFKLSNEEKSYIYSMKNPNNNLSYNYYILTKNENSIPIIKPTPNAIGLLQSKKINITPVKENTLEYKEFLTSLLLAIINTKEKVPSRK